jgi:glycosyltransferase involved in cell wall biosynthesis
LSAPDVSLIVPVYNVAQWLPACLDSIFGQDFVDLEVIAVNDGSTDNSADILADYAAREPRLRVIHQDNRGLAGARNTGLDAARGRYLWFVDSDDLLCANAVSYLHALAVREKTEMLLFNAERFSDERESSGPRIHTKMSPTKVIRGEAWIQQACAAREFTHFAWLAFFERAFLVRHGLRFHEGIAHEDIPWTTACLLRAGRMIYTGRALYRYRQNPASITGSLDNQRIVHRIESYFTIVNLLQDANATIAMQPETLAHLRSERVAQAIQVDKLIAQIADGQTRNALRKRLREMRFWQSIWPDAVNLKRKRQLAGIWLRQWLS